MSTDSASDDIPGEARTAAESHDDLTGVRMGDLQILKRLGRGGMADVYLATQVSLGRQVAVKFLRSALAKNQSYVERFRREARAAAKLSHPNIVQIFEVGQWDGRHFISQEYVDGRNLHELTDREGPLSADRAVTVLLSVAAALDAASTVGITHRDIKPENVLSGSSGEVKVADFGLARIAGPEFQSDLTQVGLTLGTPLYMSPEQVQGKNVDVRSDLYSLGVTMHHLMTGRPPFEGDSPLAIAVQHLNEQPRPISTLRDDDEIPEWLDAVILRLMAKDPGKRFQQPSGLIEYVESKLGGAGLGTSGATRPIRLQATRELQSVMQSDAPASRRRWIAWAACLLPIAGLLAGTSYARKHRPPTISDVMSAQPVEIEAKSSVSRQFFAAMRTGTPAAWQAVWENFPESEHEENKLYAAKARIQLARLYDQEDSPAQSERIAREVMNNPDLPPHLSFIASAYVSNALRKLKKNGEAANIDESLKIKWRDLPESSRALVRVGVPRRVLDRLEL